MSNSWYTVSQFQSSTLRETEIIRHYCVILLNEHYRQDRADNVFHLPLALALLLAIATSCYLIHGMESILFCTPIHFVLRLLAVPLAEDKSI